MSAQQAQLDPLMFLDVDQDPLGFLNDPFNARDWSRSGACLSLQSYSVHNKLLLSNVLSCTTLQPLQPAPWPWDQVLSTASRIPYMPSIETMQPFRQAPVLRAATTFQ